MPATKSGLRALRGHCEVHLQGQDGGVSLSIPVVRLGPGRPATTLLSDYLSGRNKAGKGPGIFILEGDSVLYRALVPAGDPDAVANTALAMQKTVEKLGPKVLNIIR